MNISISVVIIIITVLVSFRAFSDPELKYKLIFYPYKINGEREWYRFITSGFIHADIQHLVFNMITLYFFGRNVEFYFDYLMGGSGKTVFILFYVAAMAAASTFSYFKHKDNPGYMALGASGAVSAVLFSTILVSPWNLIYVFLIPCPAILFGVAYLIYSARMAKLGRDNIGHDAHLFGAIFGVIATIVIAPETVEIFIKQLLNPGFLQ
ncbi:MAG: rhomboid family intramembrane serine protease [Bacteroidetes bacterium]|nr:rhomboid family intramembrane serine protease [Bacteroidota bacterium]